MSKNKTETESPVIEASALPKLKWQARGLRSVDLYAAGETADNNSPRATVARLYTGNLRRYSVQVNGKLRTIVSYESGQSGDAYKAAKAIAHAMVITDFINNK